MSVIVGIRFKPVGKIYYFSPENIKLAVGDGVIVETARGIEYGKVVIAPREENNDNIVTPLKPVVRKASKDDAAQVERNLSKRDETMRLADEKVKKHNLDMKLTDAEYTFDAQKVIFYFTAEGRIDFRELVRDLASVFKVRIELRQIGIRDESKLIGGIAPCGRVCCCASFLGDFEKVSIKMAKTQGLSLNPTKISGLCGRLMCCLSYENEHYAETGALMPKLGAMVSTPEGKGQAIANDMLRRRVTVRVEKGDDMNIEQFELADVVFGEKLQTLTQNKPNNDTNKPNNDTNKPNNDTNKPNNDVRKPSNESRKPNNDARKPNNEVRKPNNDSVKSNNEVRKPNNDSSSPHNEVRKPSNDSSKSNNEIKKN